MQNLFSVKDKVVIITGASSGIGRHFALTLAEAGAKVILGARRLEKINSLAAEITAKGEFALPIELDVTHPESIHHFVAQVDKTLGNIDVLINNAGADLRKTFFEHEISDWNLILDTNLKGVLLMSQAVARLMIRYKTGGSIVNISSAADVMTYKGGSPAYIASKAAVMHLTHALAVELAADNIRVNAISPGGFDTEMTEGLFTSDFGLALKEKLPFKRYPELSELDGALFLLVSNASSYMTGAIIRVDGGMAINKLSI